MCLVNVEVIVCNELPEILAANTNCPVHSFRLLFYSFIIQASEEIGNKNIEGLENFG